MKNSILILFLGTFVISIAQVPSKGLISHYPFNGNAKDSTASMNHGTLNGPILTKDRFGNSNSAYQFDGMNDYIDFGSDASLRPNSITVNFWVKISPNNKHMFFMNNVLPGPGTWGFTSFYAIDGTGWRTTVGAGSNDHVLAIKSNLDPDTSKWQMFTSTYDTKSGDLKLYIDCKFISKQNKSQKKLYMCGNQCKKRKFYI